MPRAPACAALYRMSASLSYVHIDYGPVLFGSRTFIHTLLMHAGTPAYIYINKYIYIYMHTYVCVYLRERAGESIADVHSNEECIPA